MIDLFYNTLNLALSCTSKLRQNLEKDGIKLPPFPSQRINKSDPQELDDRRRDLEVYLQSIVNVPAFAHDQLHAFLDSRNAILKGSLSLFH